MIAHHVVEVATNTPVNPVYFYLGSEKFVLAFELRIRLGCSQLSLVAIMKCDCASRTQSK